MFSAIKLIKEKRLLNKLFPKWIGVEKSNYEKQSNNVQVAPRERKIVEQLLKTNQVVFVSTAKLDQKIIDIFKDDSQKLITIPNIDNKEYHYWKVTGIEGHWNRKGHELVVSSLLNRVKLIK